MHASEVALGERAQPEGLTRQAIVLFLVALAFRFVLTAHLGHGFPFLTFFPASCWRPS
ncbi:MAG: hypothetical protein H7274_21865 [Rhodoferax sp.]|nr:hypothetical protein [Rhodoferax sp.]